MEINNVFSPVPFYANKRYWHSNKWYTYGQKCPIIMTAEKTLPFQLVVSPGVTLSSFTIKKADNDASLITVNTAGSYFNIDAETYSIIQVKACAIGALPYGNYYYALTLSDGSTYISDIIAIISDMSKCIKITYKNVENLYFSSGHIDFTNDFVFELYLPTTIGKPEYEYEEELTKRLGYKFVESQVVNKVYKFTFPATEQLCDAYRFVCMCDYIRIDTYNPDFSDYDHYNIIYLSSEVEWLDNGDIASVETSFETDSIVQKLQDYSRTQLVNFYNALLSNSDEALKFDDETIAQYYSNYIQSIDGKMIRQLNAVSSISDNTVIAIDENNGTGAANKILLKPLLINTVAEQLQASEVLANFQQHINNSAIHITAAERAVLSLFGVDDNGDVYVKGDKGFYTNSFVSAKGKSSSTGGGSGASALYQLVDVLANSTNDGVQGATANSVLMYNGTKWYAGTIDAGLDETALKAYLDANKYTTTAYVDSQISTINSQLDTKADKTSLQQHINDSSVHITAAEKVILSLFGVDDNGDVYVKGDKGFYTTSFVSALGKNSSGSSIGSASALYQLVDVLANSNNDGVQGATTNSVLMYNGTKWYAGTVNTGLDEAALKSYLDTNKYTTTTYVDSQLDTKADKTALNAYLPLSGGAITGDLTINGAIYVGATNYVYHTGNLAGDNTWITLASDTISHKTIHANNITLIASSGQFVTGYTVDKAGHIVSISQRALNASDIPNIAITQVTGLQDALDKKVDNAFFAKVFGLLDTDGNEITVNDVTTIADSIKAKFGLWTEQYISALGKNSSSGGSGGTSALYQLVDVLANSTNDGVLNATNGSVLMYNGSKWQAGNVVTDISPLTLNVNGSNLFTYDGKSSITANLTVPTKISQLTNDTGFITGISSSMVINALGYTPYNSTNPNGYISSITKAMVEGVLTGNITSHTHSYLPLSGGYLNGEITFGSVQSYSTSYESIVNYMGYLHINIRDNKLYLSKMGTNGLCLDISDISNPVKQQKFQNKDGYIALTSDLSAYLPLSGGTMTGNILAKDIQGVDTSNRLIFRHLDGQNCNGDYNLYLQYYQQSSVIYLNGSTYKIYNKGAEYNGNAATATALTTSAGSATLPIYFSSGKPVACTASSVFSNLSNSGNSLSVTVAGQNRTLTINYASNAGNADTVDSTHLSMWYKHAKAYPAGKYDKPWHKIATFSQSTSGRQINTSITFYISGFHDNRKYGIFTVRARFEANATSPEYFTVDFMVNAGIPTTDIVATWKNTGSNNITINIYAYRTGWSSYSFRKIEEQNWGGQEDTWVTIDAINGDSNCYASIPSDENKSTSVNIDISNNVFSATKLQTPRTIWGQSFDGTNNVSGDLDATGGIIKANYYQITNIGTGTYNVGAIFTGANGDTTYGLNLEAACDSTGATRLPIFIGWRGGKQIMRIMDDLGVAIYHRAHIGQNTSGTAVIDAFDGVARFGCDDYGNGSTKAYMAIRGLTGNVGIGTTSPNLKLHVYSEVGDVLRVQSTQSYTCIVYQDNGSYQWSVGSMNNNTFYFWNSYKSANVAQVDINGNFSSIGAVTAKASSSDIRLKTDITDYKALSIIRSHKSIKYHWNEVAKANADIFNDDYWHYGLIAQDVQRDMPQMVSDVFKDYLVINYERLIPICWKGLQEVDDEVTKLKKKVRKLEMEIRELKQERA